MATPKWLRDIDASLSIRSHFVLSGNIRDYVLMGRGGTVACPLVDALWLVLESRGFQGILVWDPVDGLTSYPEGRAVQLSDGSLSQHGKKSPADLAKILRAVSLNFEAMCESTC